MPNDKRTRERQNSQTCWTERGRGGGNHHKQATKSPGKDFGKEKQLAEIDLNSGVI